MTQDSKHWLAHLIRSDPGVHVERIKPNDDHLAWCTIQLMFGETDEIGTDRLAVFLFKAGMLNLPSRLNFYANPATLVTASAPTRRFLLAAESEKKAWHHRLRSLFFSSVRTQSYFGLRGWKRRTSDPALRQLEFHGVLVLGGKHIFPHCWPDPKTLSYRPPLVGRTFGRLTVVEDLPGGKHVCQCKCGNTKTADRFHLEAGRVKSCGCLTKERQATIAARRNHRGR
jgi:hypothetical protein